VRRREFITLVGGAATWPLAARAQQPAMPVIGVLYAGSSAGASPTYAAAFRKGIGQAGFIEGQNVALDFRFAENKPDLLPEIAADLVRRRVAVIVVPGSTIAVRVAKAATTRIPIVFMNANDPVQAGLVTSLSRPGGNITGITDMGVELAAKRLGLLHELLPSAKRIVALLYGGDGSNAPEVTEELRTATAGLGMKIDLVRANTNTEINSAFETIAHKQAEGLWVGTGSLFLNSREQITSLAARYAIPAIYPLREFTDVGGLMSYGSSIADRSRLAGIYAGRILNGENPADLPVMRNTKFDLVINLRTAKALGIAVPVSLHTQAEEVIE
jgi:putative ABC transport system substrate-binding protein